MSNLLLDKLALGDMRTTGKSDEVVQEVLSDVNRFDELFAGLEDARAGVRMRSADALEKVTRVKPELLHPYVDKLINIAESASQQEVQWHIAQMFEYAPLNRAQKEKAFEILVRYYNTSRSNIVKAFSLTALAHIAKGDPTFEKEIKALLEMASEHEAPSVRSRAKKIQKLYRFA